MVPEKVSGPLGADVMTNIAASDVRGERGDPDFGRFEKLTRPVCCYFGPGGCFRAPGPSNTIRDEQLVLGKRSRHLWAHASKESIRQVPGDGEGRTGTGDGGMEGGVGEWCK